MFSNELNQLGTYWLEKLPNVSFEETLLSCLEKKMHGTQPAHAQFYYPKKFGYGELWQRMAVAIKKHIHYNVDVASINSNNLTVNDIYEADKIITTIPWLDVKTFVGMPERLQRILKNLKYSSIQTEYFPEKLETQSQWIYYPDPKLSYHRILVRHNFSPNSKGYWTETNSERVIINSGNFKYLNKYAYPLNTLDKSAIMKELLDWAASKNVIGLGRWGEWQHYNSDVTVMKAIELSSKMN
jgi:UDP-galactopyranose mutase